MTAPSSDYSRKWWVLLSIGMGTFLATVDGTIVSVARPTIEAHLDTDFNTVQWVTLAYLLTVTVLLLGMGRLGDMVGKQRPYLFGVVLFGIGSALCAVAPTIELLIAFRVLQAVGAAAQQALGSAIIAEAFPPSERGRALGLGGLLVSAGILTGPVVGGFLLDAFHDWRPLFLVNIPVVIIAIPLVLRFVPGGGSRPGQRFDLLGGVTLGISLTALMLALTFGPDLGWGSVLTLGLFALAAGMLGLFITLELRTAQPMVDLTLFRNPQFAISLTAAVLVFVGVASREVLPFFLERGLQVTHREIGLVLAVWPLAMAFTAPLAGWLSDRVGSMRIATLGLAVGAAGYLLCGFNISLAMTLPVFALLILPTGLGVGLFQSPNNSAVLGSVPRERLGLASGFLALTRNLGQLVGIAAVGTLWATRTLDHLPPELQGVLSDAAEAPPQAIAAGTADTFLLLGVVMVMTTLLGAAGVWVEQRRGERV